MTAALRNFSNEAALPQAKILLTVHLSQFVVSDDADTYDINVCNNVDGVNAHNKNNSNYDNYDYGNYQAN